MVEQGIVRESGKVECTAAIAVTKGWRSLTGAERAVKHYQLDSKVGEWSSDELVVCSLLGGVTRVSKQANRLAATQYCIMIAWQ